MLTEFNTGVLGAKVQSFSRVSVRELLIRSLYGLSTVDRENRKLVLDTFKEDLNRSADRDAMVDSIIEYWFSNHYRSIVESDPVLHATRMEQSAVRASKIKQHIASAINEKVKQIALLELIMPNGKPLCECTGAECKSAGGWLAKIAKRIKPNEIVGVVLSEKDLRDLYAG